MENDISLADQNSTCLSTSSSTSSTDEDIQPEVRNQFMKLAEALKETNQNLLTFEFMLGQYRKLARIEPFNTNEEIQQSTELEQQQISDKSEVLDQLRCLTEAVNNLQDKQHPASMSELSESVLNNQESSKKLIDEVFTIREQMKQLSEANVAAGFLRSKVADLEISLNEKNLRIDGLAASHKRVTAQLSEERDRCQELDRKLESEKRAAAQVGKDITKYVERMNELETKLKSSDPKICELETRLAEKSQLCDNLTEQNVALKKQLEKEQVKNVELESSSGSSLRNEVSKYAKQISDLELRLRADSKEKESLQTTIDILKDQLSESRQQNESRPSNNDTVNSTFSNSGLCRTCLDGSERLEDTAKKVQQLAVEIQQRTEIEVARLSTQNVTLLKENRELESSLRREQNLRHTLETKVTVCEHEIRSYEAQVKEWKEELENLQNELQRCQMQQQTEPVQACHLQKQTEPEQGCQTHLTVPESRAERKEKRRLERELQQLKLQLADTLASKEALSSQEVKLVNDLEETKVKLSTTEVALIRLRGKSKTLLKQYRAKKQSYSELCGKLDSIRLCLLELKNLCRTKDENYRDIMDHLGSQIQISARLVAVYLDMTYNYDTLNLSAKVKLSNWFCAIQALSTWTHKELMIFGTRCWTGLASKSCDDKGFTRKDVDVDTLSEISQTFEQDSEREKSVRSLVEAQDRISRTQNESFETLLSRMRISVS